MGTPTKLLQEIRNHAQTMGIKTDPKHFPEAPNAFMRRINTASSSLQALGFEVLTRGGMQREVIISPGKQAKLLPEYADDQSEHAPKEEEKEQPYFNQCYFCGQPIYKPDAVTNGFSENRPAHKGCYEKKFGELKEHSREGGPLHGTCAFAVCTCRSENGSAAR
jgi:hypothetical protein